MTRNRFHSHCVTNLKAEQQILGVEVDVFARPPRPPSLHLKEWVCPHNVTYYYQASRMQVERWLRAGTRAVPRAAKERQPNT
jgi:hypothetical protein